MVNSCARWENRDGVAIWEVAKRVRKFTQNPCIMLVLSDGQPAAFDYHGGYARRDVKKKVEEIEKMGYPIDM